MKLLFTVVALCVLSCSLRGGPHRLNQMRPSRTATGTPPARKCLTKRRRALRFEKIDGNIALPACEKATRRYPESSRLVYLLGRVKLRTGDFKGAHELFRRAADQHYAPAEHALGNLYAKGEGVQQSDDAAFSWFRRSAENGDALGQFSFGVSCTRKVMARQRTSSWPELSVSKISGPRVRPSQKESGYFIWFDKRSRDTQARNDPAPPSTASRPTVVARGLGVVPFAIVCADHEAVSMMFRLYAAHWERAMQDRLTGGASRLVHGASEPPDPEILGCAVFPPGTVMVLERKIPVPVVAVKATTGEEIRGVTLPGMISRP